MGDQQGFGGRLSAGFDAFTQFTKGEEERDEERGGGQREVEMVGTEEGESFDLRNMWGGGGEREREREGEGEEEGGTWDRIKSWGGGGGGEEGGRGEGGEEGEEGTWDRIKSWGGKGGEGEGEGEVEGGEGGTWDRMKRFGFGWFFVCFLFVCLFCFIVFRCWQSRPPFKSICILL